MIRRSFFLPREETVALVDGHWMRFAPYAPFYPEMTTGTYDRGTARLLERVIVPGMVVVDVGAHVGFFSLLAARKVGPSGKVYAFEPDPSTYNLLFENIGLNGYHNVVAIRKAVWKRGGFKELFLNPRDSRVNTLYPSDAVGERHVSVETITLDDFFEREGWPPVHVIKMDIEGAEIDAMEGMTQLLTRSEGLSFIVEFAPGPLLARGVTRIEYLETLKRLGLRIRFVEDGGDPIPFNEEVYKRIVRMKVGLVANLLCEKSRS
jgi:FkbM family methyltransferase